MKFKVDDILKDVRVILDENEVDTALIDEGDVDTLTLNDLIRSKIEDSVRAVVTVAPLYLLDVGEDFPDQTISWDGAVGMGYGWIPLPDNYLRLSYFKMSDWLVPVVTAISDIDPLYPLQKSKFAGVRGNTHRPICAVTIKDGKRVLEFYSCLGGMEVTIAGAKYHPLPRIEVEQGAEVIEISEKIYVSVKYYIAGMVAMAYKDEQATTLITQATDSLK